MNDGRSRSKQEAPKSDVRKPFEKMTRNEKTVFVLQLVVCICTFGFVFPNVMG
jgi:hypothetical protein